MPKRGASTLGSFRLLFSLGFLLFATNLIAQEKSATPPANKPSDESVPVIVDAAKIEGGSELSADEKESIANGLQGETAHSDWLDRLSAKATKQLQDDGFLDGTAVARVDSTRLLDAKQHVTILVALTAGTRYLIQKIWWTGSSLFSTARLDNLSLLRVGDVFRRSALSASVSLLMREYGERGYQQVTLEPHWQMFPKFGKVAVYFDVVEGPKSEESKHVECKQYTIADIQNAAYVPSPAYDPAIEGQLQIARAELEAQRTKKKVLLIVGGKWCGWCRVLDQTFQRNPATSALRDNIFIVAHINVSEENANECALRAYPKASGFPFIYVLDASGKLIATEDTRDWESGDGYDPQRIESFFKKW
jgi:hypothetical protein